jgi:spoIIIJ-associated protein
MDPIISEEIEKIINLILFPFYNKKTECEIEREGDQWRINLKIDEYEMFIENNSEILKAIQHYLRVSIHKKFPEDRTHFILDIGMYRQKRENILKEKIRSVAEEKVLQEGTTLILINLSSYERKVVHNLLVEVDGLETTSVGQGSHRKLIIRPTSEVGSKGMDEAKVIDIFSLEKNS